jgi:hypothetical protein
VPAGNQHSSSRSFSRQAPATPSRPGGQRRCGPWGSVAPRLRHPRRSCCRRLQGQTTHRPGRWARTIDTIELTKRPRTTARASTPSSCSDNSPSARGDTEAGSVRARLRCFRAPAHRYPSGAHRRTEWDLWPMGGRVPRDDAPPRLTPPGVTNREADRCVAASLVDPQRWP